MGRDTDEGPAIENVEAPSPIVKLSPENEEVGRRKDELVPAGPIRGETELDPNGFEPARRWSVEAVYFIS